MDDIRYQRQIMGVIKAKAHGVHIGRPRKLSQEKLLQALDLKQYHTNLHVANKFGVSKSTLLRNLGEFREAG